MHEWIQLAYPSVSRFNSVLPGMSTKGNRYERIAKTWDTRPNDNTIPTLPPLYIIILHARVNTSLYSIRGLFWWPSSWYEYKKSVQYIRMSRRSARRQTEIQYHRCHQCIISVAWMSGFSRPYWHSHDVRCLVAMLLLLSPTHTLSRSPLTLSPSFTSTRLHNIEECVALRYWFPIN